MADRSAIADIHSVLAGNVLLPTITMWNRLEGRPRTDSFDRALRAEVRDALWMLTKQWQMGEFEGDDAGSPVTAKVHVETTRLTRYRAADHPTQAFEADVPLEAKVEQRSIPFRSGDQELALDLRLLMGRRWLRLVGELEAGLRQKFIAAYAVAEPDPKAVSDALVCAHTIAWQQTAAVAGRMMDGRKLYEHLTADPAHHAYDTIVLDDETNKPAIEAAEHEFVSWFEALFYEPLDERDDAWLPHRLEYAFACSAPSGDAQRAFVAEQYHHGHLDWYNLDVDPSTEGLGDVEVGPEPPDGVEEAITRSFVPTPIQFDGMPHTRWWTFEDGRTNFGDIDPDTTDVNKLLLIEFGLVYANDWFLLPFTVPAGTITNVRGMTVTNVFGERTWIEPTGRGGDESWQRWTMYSLATKGREDVPGDLSLVVVPSVPKIQEGTPSESVALVRDEVANMVWGIETTVPLPTGDGKTGRSAALDVRRFHHRIVQDGVAGDPPHDEDLENDAAIAYQLMTRVPEHWIPFIPVHVEDDIREIQLCRAALPRIIERDPDPPRKTRPRANLLRHGLDVEPPHAYDVHEEEVPRVGARVTQSFQRTRWYDGRVFTWFGARKQVGARERSSELRFDQIRPMR